MFADEWEKIEKQFNLTERDTVTLTTENFRKAMFHAYQRGEESAAGADLFGKLFGGSG